MGRPKKEKRAYNRKEKVETETKKEDEFVDTIANVVEEETEEIEVEEIIEDEQEPASEYQPEKQKQMFYNLEEGRIKLEEAERKKREEIEKIERLAREEASKDLSRKPKLVCIFCSNVQYELNSKDPTSAWCTVCGRCFSADWK